MLNDAAGELTEALKSRSSFHDLYADDAAETAALRLAGGAPALLQNLKLSSDGLCTLYAEGVHAHIYVCSSRDRLNDACIHEQRYI